MNTKVILALVAVGGAGYLLFHSKGAASSGPLTRATTFQYVFEGVSQDFTQEQLETFERKIEEQTPALGVEFSELPTGEILFAFTLPAGATPPARVMRLGSVVARRRSALPAVEG